MGISKVYWKLESKWAEGWMHWSGGDKFRFPLLRVGGSFDEIIIFALQVSIIQSARRSQYKQQVQMFNTLGSLGQANLNNQSSTPTFNLISLFERDLQYIAQEHIQQLCRKIYPVEMSVSNPYNALYRTLINYCSIQSNKGNSYDTIAFDVARIASTISQALSLKLADIFKKEEVKKKLCDSVKRVPSSETQNNSHIHPNALASKPNARAVHSTTLLQNLGAKYGEETASKYGNLLNKQLNETFRKDHGAQQDVSASIAEKYMKEKINVQNLATRIQFQKELTHMGQVSNKKCLICDNFLAPTDNYSRKLLFQCKDCRQLYHRKCMPRDSNCCVCQMRSINPLQKVKTILFVGFIKKGAKKHEIQFQFKKQHEESGLEQREKNGKKSTLANVQLRSIRLKDKNDAVANFINLFPDACTIMVNNRLVKQFQPLHKQSSLKYRRDECLKISSNLHIGLNKITITQRILKREIKTDERIQPENHLVGVCIVEGLQVPKPANKLEQFLTKSGYMVNNSPTAIEKFLLSMDSIVTEFRESQNLLKQSLFISSREESGQQEEEIACDNVKAPLICSLTLQKMKYPGRSIFCKHFACFDVHNFILLNSQAKLPKWQCPICKASAYKFQIDCIMKSIVSELTKIAQNRKFKEDEEPVQVQFDANFAMRFLNSEGKTLINKKARVDKKNKAQSLQTETIPYWLSTIYDLPIEGKSKRERQMKEQAQCLKKNQLLLDSLLPQEEDSNKRNMQNHPDPKQNLMLPENIIEAQPQTVKPQQIEQQQKLPQIPSPMMDTRNFNTINQVTQDKYKFCNFTVVIKPIQPQDNITSNLCFLNPSDAATGNEVGLQNDKLQTKEKQNKLDGNLHFEHEQVQQKESVALGQQNEQGLEEHQLSQKCNFGADPLSSEKMSSEDLEMEKALRQYEEHRKLRNAIKPQLENEKQGHFHQKEQMNPFEEENQKMNAFYSSYHSFLGEPEPEIKGQNKSAQVSNHPQNEVAFAQGLGQNQKGLIGNELNGQELQRQREQKNSDERNRKVSINLFKGYTTRNNPEQGPKRKTIKSIEAPKKVGSISRSRNTGKEKEKQRKPHEKGKSKSFELPEDADIIQLSD